MPSEAGSVEELPALTVICINVLLSLGAGYTALCLMRQYIPIFIQRKLYGRDQCKATSDPIPEPMGVIAAAVYLIFMFLFIPVPFFHWMNDQTVAHLRLLALLSGIISICTAILLGFADDVLDLRWRHKLLFPTLSSLPLLIVYYISGDLTAVLLPKYFENLLGTSYIDIGFLFYIYMSMIVVFCTNAINIIAGINGVEVSQGLIIGASVALFNAVQIVRLDLDARWHHALSLCILLPFIATSYALYKLNKFPAKVFVGDTYCYWAGMTLAVVGILGHFSKTLLLFCVPQIFNFVYSVPQLFHFIPCPRHRLPRFDRDGDKLLHMSMAEFEPAKLSIIGRIFLLIFRATGLLYYREFEKDGTTWAEINNLTILNLILKIAGPMSEAKLNATFMAVQLCCSIIAFVCRFYFAYLLYDVVH